MNRYLHHAKAAAMAFALLLTSVGCDPDFEPQDPLAGYHVSDDDMALELRELDDAVPYRARVGRFFSSPEEERLLRIAESMYPPSETILLDLQQHHHSPASLPDPGDEELWWTQTFDGVRLPYAITRSGVDYYLGLTEAFRAGEFDSVGTIAMLSSSLNYSVVIERHSDFVHEGNRFSDVYVVEMRLAWSNYCGSLCALWFTKSRLVILTPNGTLRAIFGDGITSYSVS